MAALQVSVLTQCFAISQAPRQANEFVEFIQKVGISTCLKGCWIRSCLSQSDGEELPGGRVQWRWVGEASTAVPAHSRFSDSGKGLPLRVPSHY